MGFVSGRISRVLKRLTHIPHCVHVVETFGWVGFFFFSFRLVVPMVPIARVRGPFQWLVSIGVGYLRSVAWRIGGYKGVGLVVVRGPKDAQRVQMEPTGCYS